VPDPPDATVRQRQRHTALTWMADAGVDVHIVQRAAGHQDPAVRACYLHPDVQAMLNAGTAFSAWCSVASPEHRRSALSRVARMSVYAGPTKSEGSTGLVGLAKFELATLDPQSSALRPLESALVRSRRSQPRLDSGGRWRHSLNALQLLQSLLQRPRKGEASKTT
jgi:hypothetical protein